jgi:hypothetical protein
MLFIYIAGPMAGLPNQNVAAFDAAARVIRAAEHVAVNPADNSRALADKAGVSLAEYRARFTDTQWRQHVYKLDVTKLISCDGILLLTGWHKSRGATLEALIARQLGLRFFWLDNSTQLVETTSAVASVDSFAALHLEAEREPKITHLGSASKVEKDDPQESICLEADRLVDGARQKTYGHPYDNYSRVARLWETYLYGKYQRDSNLEVVDVIYMMVLLKVGRLQHGYHRDSVVDIAGYAKLADMINARIKETEQ